MSLNSSYFLVIFLVSLLIVFAFKRFCIRHRWVILCGYSFIYIVSQGLGSAGILLGALGLTFYFANKIGGRSPRGSPETRRLYLASIASILLLWCGSRLLNLGTQISISFVMLWLIAYLTELFSGQIEKFEPIKFAALGTSFYNMAAGPVLDVKSPSVDNTNPSAFSGEVLNKSLMLIFWGLAKKTLADFIFVNLIGSNKWLANDGVWGAWALELFRTVWLYCDFSGYTDISRGMAFFFGVELPQNFNLPFLKTKISAYWNSWNASVTHWFFNYVFIPVTLNLRALNKISGKLVSYIGIFATFMLIGLWHKFSHNQVYWAVAMSVFFIIENLLLKNLNKVFLGGIIAWAFTQYTMLICRLLSVETNASVAIQTIKSLHGLGNTEFSVRALYWFCVGGLAIAVLQGLDSMVMKFERNKLLFILILFISFFVITVFDTKTLNFYYEGI